ncbi:MAG: hypothetical protein HC863_00670 [Myxococcales bacterium]|nr:hypothetical protein [Myxococcales bacterium]
MANQQSGDGSCDKCHQSGQGAMIANAATNPDLLPMFPLLKTNAYFLATFYTVNVAQKPYSMTFNQAAFTRVATRTFPHQDHPNFTADPANNNAQGLKAMKDFLDKTKLALDAQGNCPTPRQ